MDEGAEVKSVKKEYAEPQLVEYGRIGSLTLGSGGTLPDIFISGVLLNNNCPTAVNPDGTTRVACIVSDGSN